jgi:hypothetical protein
MDATSQEWLKKLDVIRDEVIRQCNDLAEKILEE